jgi:hypothetical protein
MEEASEIIYTPTVAVVKTKNSMVPSTITALKCNLKTIENYFGRIKR